MTPEANQNTFLYALTVQKRVLGALVLREMRAKHGKSQIGYVWALIEPVGYVAMMVAAFSYIDRNAAFGTSIALFYGLGVIPFKLFTLISNQLTGAMTSNRQLLSYPIVQSLDTVLARFFLESATSIVVFIVFLLCLSFVDDIPMPSDPLRIMQGFALLMLFAFGVGLTNAVIIRRIPSWQNAYKIMTAPLLLVSAIFYSFDTLPSELRYYVSWVPIGHGVEIVRDGYYSHYRLTDVSAEYIFGVGLVLTVIGLFGERYFPERQ
jgi:capsular polysaccharide transport system permease protein